MTVYIAGPMSGLINYNRDMFIGVERMLEERGICALNPANLPVGMPDEKCMPIRMAMVEAADAVYTLPEWSKSLGASAEVFYAMRQSKPIFNSIKALKEYAESLTTI